MTDKEYVEMMLRKDRARRAHVLVSKDEQASIPRSSGASPTRVEPGASRQLPKALEPLKHDLLDSEANAKRKALATLAKHRKDARTPKGSSTSQKPIASEKMSPLRSCRTCYYCNDRRRVGGSWWCRCTNPGRSASETGPASGWVKGRINLPCWRPVCISATESKEPSDPHMSETRASKY